MDFTPSFPASSPFLGFPNSLGVSGAIKSPLFFYIFFLFFYFFLFSFFLLFSLYFQAKPHAPTGRVGRSRFAFVPPLWDLARRGLAGGSGCVKLSSSLSPRRKTPHVQHPVSARAGDGRG